MELISKDNWASYWRDNKWPSSMVIDTNLFYHLRLLDEIFCKFLHKDKTKQFLELGCGCGDWLIYFNKKFGYKVYGVEYTQAGCEISKRNLEINNVKGIILNKDIFNLNFRRESFDIVCSVGLVEHFDSPKEILRIHYNLLKKGGILIIECPNYSAFNKFIDTKTDCNNSSNSSNCGT